MVVRFKPTGYEVTVNGEATESVTAKLSDRTELVSQYANGRMSSTVIPSSHHKLHVFTGGKEYTLHQSVSELEAEEGASAKADNLSSPMPATIIDVRVKPGDKVTNGQVCCVLESMKMEINVRAGRDGVVKSVRFDKGQTVEEGVVLVELEHESA